MGAIEHHEALTAWAARAREVPGERAAPVVPDDAGAVGAKVIEERRHVPGERAEVEGACGAAQIVAAQVRGDDAKAGRCHRADLVPP
jgi:hypothetical protein